MKTLQLAGNRLIPLAVGLLLIRPCCWPSEGPAESSLATELKKLHAVGSEGQGNADAARAWNQIVTKANANELPRLLAELNGAGELAANWIRGAIEAVAERELARGGQLPAEQLEKFALNTGHSPRARRLAFEWLLAVDPGAKERLIPGMLHDPGAEFRRDAVEHGWIRTEAANLEGEAAVAAYRKLMDAARDEDQVRKIRKRLEELGVEVDLRRHFGYVTEWALIGPFDNTDESGLETAYAPEREIELGHSYPGKTGEVKWIEHETKDDYGKVDLNRAVGRAKGVLAYAHSEFWSRDTRDVEIRLSTVNAWKLWLNGELLYTRNEYHHGTQFDHYRVEARLRPGRNVILLKVCQNELREKYAEPWKFQLRVCDAVGTAVLSARASDAERKDGKEPEDGRRRGSR